MRICCKAVEYVCRDATLPLTQRVNLASDLNLLFAAFLALPLPCAHRSLPISS